jgi:acyl-CoA thioesterase I
MSFMWLLGPRRLRSVPERSYGALSAAVQILRAALCALALAAAAMPQPASAATAVKIVALGDSLTAGYGLPEKDGFVPRLRAALAAKGIAVEIDNAGVSGDTASDGLDRLDWSVPAGTDAVIVELGANDMLRGLKPEQTREALDAMLRRLSDRHIAVLLCGMRAAPNLGADYGAAFDGIYPALAAKFGVLLDLFFLDGVAANLSLVQHDGMHPNAAGVDVIVARILPEVEQLIAKVRAQHPS